MTKNNFQFYIPLEKDKVTKGEKDGKTIYYFEGLASDGTKDADDEYLNPDGFDLSEFKFVNWNHGKDPEDQIGVPLESRVIPGEGFYVKGALFGNTEKGKDTIDLMEALEHIGNETGKYTRLGISVEGQVLERNMLNPKKVERAKITAIAICPFPKNPSTWATLIRKGFTGNDPKIFIPQKTILFKGIVGEEFVIIDSDLNISKDTVVNCKEKSINILKKGYESGKISEKTVVDLRKKFLQ